MRTKLLIVITLLLATSIVARSENMKAIVVHEYGGPEVLKFEDVPIPEPKEDEMLIKVFAAGVNSFDGVLRSGKYAKVFKTQLPWNPGYDVAGTVEKVGSKVTKFKVGDSVYAFISIRTGGSYAEYAIAKQNQAALKPATISFVEAACVPSVALTAWQAIVDKANLQADQTVLIQGASGGWGCSRSRLQKSAAQKSSQPLRLPIRIFSSNSELMLPSIIRHKNSRKLPKTWMWSLTVSAAKPWRDPIPS